MSLNAGPPSKSEREIVLEQEIADLKERLALAETEAKAFSVRARAVEAELQTLRTTTAFQIVFRYWNAISRFLPEGGRARRLYRSLRGRLGPAPAARRDPKWYFTPAQRRLAALEVFLRSSRGGPNVPIAAIFSPTKFRESEGQRSTQWAREFLRRGWRVVFCHWRWEETDWDGCLESEGRLFTLPIDVLAARPSALFGGAASADRIAFFQFPHPILFETFAAAAGHGWITVYDVMDDWEEFHRVGQGVWFDAPFERHVARGADLVTAVNDSLASKIGLASARKVQVVANGVRPDIARVDRRRRLSRGEVTVGYFGYFASGWFDWELLRRSAELRPAWRFYLIGYGEVPRPLPRNVRFLGRKSQAQLAAFAANWDVGIVPFKREPLAALADPIKTYEYLAMGLPAVVAGAPAPAGGEGLVRRAGGAEEFLRAVGEAAAEGPSRAEERRAFAAANTWERRLAAILEAIDRDDQRVGEKRALFGAGA